MPLSWNEIKDRALAFSKERADETSEDAETKSFWDGFFNVFGAPRRGVLLPHYCVMGSVLILCSAVRPFRPFLYFARISKRRKLRRALAGPAFGGNGSLQQLPEAVRRHEAGRDG